MFLPYSSYKQQKTKNKKKKNSPLLVGCVNDPKALLDPASGFCKIGKQVLVCDVVHIKNIQTKEPLDLGF